MSTIYLDLDPELTQALADQRLTIADLLAQTGLDAQMSYGVLPTDEQQTARSKDLVPLILASGTSISIVITALSHAFRTYVRRPHVVEVEKLEELRDAKGNVLLDAAGKPVFKRTKHPQILEPQKADTTGELEVNIGPSGFVAKFKTSEEQRDQPAPKP